MDIVSINFRRKDPSIGQDEVFYCNRLETDPRQSQAALKLRLRDQIELGTDERIL